MIFPDRFYTLLVPARCKNKICIFDRGPPVRPPAARRPKNDSRPDFFLHCVGVHQIKFFVLVLRTRTDKGGSLAEDRGHTTHHETQSQMLALRLKFSNLM